MISTVIRHESAMLLRSAQIWLIAALIAALFGYLFLTQVQAWLNVQTALALEDKAPGLTGFLAARFLAPLAMLFSIIAPLFAMRAFSNEYRLASFPLWQSSPISSTALVIGKYTGILLVLLLLVLLPIGMVLAMGLFVPIDLGTLASATLGLTLSTAAFTATGLYFSSLTRHAMIAVLASLALLLLLWLIGSAASSAQRVGGALPLDALRGFSIGERVAGFFQGFIATGDIVFFSVMTALFLALTVVRLDALRDGGTE